MSRLTNHLSSMPYRKYREWQCGVGLFAVGNVLNFVSFGELLAFFPGCKSVPNMFGASADVQELSCVCFHAGFAAQSLLAALGSIQFVSNVVFAWFVLHERVRHVCWDAWQCSRLVSVHMM